MTDRTLSKRLAPPGAALEPGEGVKTQHKRVGSGRDRTAIPEGGGRRAGADSGSGAGMRRLAVMCLGAALSMGLAGCTWWNGGREQGAPTSADQVREQPAAPRPGDPAPPPQPGPGGGQPPASGGTAAPVTPGNGEAQDKPLRFAVMGDSRGASHGTNEATLRELMKQVKAHQPRPEFVLFTGDQVTGGTDLQSQLTGWKDIVDDYFPMTSVYPALGNHEHDQQIFSEVFSSLPKEQLAGYGRTVYAFDYSGVRFITLNSDRVNGQGKYVIDEAQRTWLEQQLSSAGGQHVFVQFHVPAYPVSAHLGTSLDGDPANRDALWDLLDQYKVTAVMVGHEHNYNRRRVDASFDGSGRHFEHGIYQLTLGGAGAPLYQGAKETKGVLVGPKVSYHYMIVDVQGGLASFKVYDLQGNEIDAFTVER